MEVSQMVRIIFSMLLVFIMAACDTAPQSGSKGDVAEPVSITSKTWQWISTVTPAEKVTVPDPARYTIAFTDNSRAQIKFDCNRGGGDFMISEQKLTFGPLMSSRMACPEDSLDATFMKDLQRVGSFFIQEGDLFLELQLHSGTRSF